jgi:hypothetical protein
MEEKEEEEEEDIQGGLQSLLCSSWVPALRQPVLTKEDWRTSRGERFNRLEKNNEEGEIRREKRERKRKQLG